MPDLNRARLYAVTGCRPDLSGVWQTGSVEKMPGLTWIDGLVESDARPIPTRVLLPDQPNGAGILYAHAHGNRYDIGKAELTDGRPALLDPPLGLHLARKGYTVFCPDLPGFGARQMEGTESALSKAALWNGRPLLGLMLDDLARAQSALAAMTGVDGARIAVLGLSMGATLAYWHAALTPSIRCCAHFCAFAQIAPMIDMGCHDLHGPYMTVPGLLPQYDMADVAALVFPRPQLIGAGLKDPLTPEIALRPALERLSAAYEQSRARLQIVIEPDGGHAETPAMRAALDVFLEDALR